MDSRVALDTAEIRSLVAALSGAVDAPSDEGTLALVRIYFYISNPWVVPTIGRELDADGDSVASRWKNFHFDEIADGDQFFLGCVKGMSNRYVDYHPDPRDCHAVAEAECAKLDAFLTRNESLLKGLAGRTESILVTTPLAYWQRAHLPSGATLRISPEQQNPLAVVDWWKW